MNVRLACTGVLVLLVAGTARAELRSVLISVKHDESRTATVGIRSDVKEEQKEGISIDQACAVVRQMRGWGSAVNVFVISDQYIGKADLKKLASAIDDNIHTELVYLRNGLTREWVDHFLGQLEVEPADPVKPNSTDTGGATLTREERLALEGLLRESELIVVGTLRRTDDSTANKMWAGHIDVTRVLLGNPSLKDVRVHFQHPTARRGAAPRETGQTGIWFVYGDGDFRQVVWPNQLRPIAFEKTLHPYLKRFLEEEINRLSKAGGDKNAARLAHLKANYQAVRVADPPSPPRAAADGQLTMQLSYAVSKPVPVPPAIAKLFREVVARPPARRLPERTFVAEWTALFRDADNVYEWYGNMLLQKNDGEQKCWGCPRLAVLWHRMMEQRANTDEKLAAALDEFERDLRRGKIPAQDKKTLRALEALGTVKRQLEQTVGGKWEVQTTDEHPLAPVLVGQVEVADTGRTRLAAYVVLPFPYDGLGRLAVWGQYRAGSHTFSVLGANESLTVLGDVPSLSLPVSQDVMKMLGLTRPTITLEAVNTAEHLRRQREKLMPNASTCFKVGFEHKDGTQEGNLDSVTEVWKLEPGKYRLEATYKSDGFAGMTTTKPPAEPWKGELQLPAVSVSVEAPAASPEMGTGHTPKIEPDAERSVAYLTGLYAEVYLVADDKVIQLLAPLAVEKAHGPIRFEPAKDRSEAWLFEGDEVAKYVLPGGCTPLPQFPPTLPGEPDPEPLYTKQAASSAAFTLTNLPAQRSFQYGGVTEVRVDELSFSSATIKVVGRLKLKLQPLPP